ncbi:LysR family transcriptional regulator [uncultured Neglectibacter sp.]|uniref:LysR family transcriptional regulator n=1 Tax=uncultured Neglectibacter sp. TaxID=1924108 RepID=UPI0034DFC0B5
MYDKVLDTFLETVERGSFSRAAEQLYLTHTAVIKQLNSLEDRLGVRLLTRSNHGVGLTPAGEVFYREAKELIRLSGEAVERVRAAGRPKRITLRVGSSALSPCQDFLEQWQRSESAARFRLQIVPFSDDRKRYEHLGRDFDFLVGSCDNLFAREKFDFLPIGQYRFELLMSREHRLAKARSLSLGDLKGETVMLMKPGVSPINDEIRHALQEKCPEAAIESILPVYNMETFNRCAESEALLVSLECWENVHPALTAVPLQEEYTIEYGLIFSKAFGGALREFLQAVRGQFTDKAQ